DVAHQHVDIELRQRRQRPLGRGEDVHLAAGGLERAREGDREALLVVDDHHPRSAHGWSAGNSRVNVAPWPGSLSKRMLPPCSSTMRWTIESPRPVPSALVVKNGSKMRARTSAGMPGPSSFTESTTWSPAGRQEITTLPCAPTAWTAFCSRLTQTC